LVTDSFGTSTWIYVGEFEEGEGTLPKDEEGRQRRIEVTTGVMAFPDPVFPMAPRAVVKRSHRVVRWTEVERGGHFPMVENGEAVVQDLRAARET